MKPSKRTFKDAAAVDLRLDQACLIPKNRLFFIDSQLVEETVTNSYLRLWNLFMPDKLMVSGSLVME